MKRPYLFFLIYVVLFLKGYSQNILNVKEKNFPSFLNTVKGSSVNSYNLLESYKSCYLELKPDSNFLFYDINSLGFYVCMGKYTIDKPFVRLKWDSILTHKLVQDSIASAKLFRFKKPIPFHVIPTVYLIKEKGLESLTLKYDKIELLLSDDLQKKEILFDSLINIQYTTFHQKKIIVRRYNKNDFSFNKDSIWGFRLYKDGAFKTFRNDTSTIKWNNMPGYQIGQIENGIIIYMVVSEFSNSIHYYFSKTLQSEIFIITKINLTKEYSHLPLFLEEVQKEYKLGLNFGNINKETNNFRLIELYRKAIKNSSDDQGEEESEPEEENESDPN